MINSKAHLHPDTLSPEALERTPTRNGFGKGLVEVGEENDAVVALCADLAESTRMHWFQEKFPERYVELGVAEQNLATVGSGFANYGKIPYIASYAAFSPGRNNEQIRTTISLNNVPVKIAGCHAGVSVGPDGATHQQLEDIALMRVQPNMTVVVPADAEEARKATIAAATYPGPVYIRLSRAGFPLFTTAETPFEIGKATVLYQSEQSSVGIVACGTMVHNALMAAEELKGEIGVSVLNLSTIKPLDTETLTKFIQSCGGLVTAEEHQIAGGMGSAVAEFAAKHNPLPIEFIGVHDRFGQSGEPEELIRAYGMNVPAIVQAVRNVHARISS